MSPREHKRRRSPRASPYRTGFSLLALYLLALLLLGFFGDRGFIRGYQLYRERARVQSHIDRLQRENRRLEAVIQQLDDNPRILERKAREDLGLVRQDEIVYLFVPAGRGGR